MGNIKRNYSASFKAKVALDIIQNPDSLTAICSKHSVHPSQGRRWKLRVIAGLSELFSNPLSNEVKQKDELIDALYKQVGQLKVELDWLKKKMESI